MATAPAGLTAESMAAAIIGRAKVKASISQEMSMSLGSRVRRLGTMAMSSKPQARRPDLPMPMSMSTRASCRRLERQRTSGGQGVSPTRRRTASWKASARSRATPAPSSMRRSTSASSRAR